MRERIRLTFPATHSQDDIQQLLDEYRARFPERFREWVEIERTFTKSDDDPLREIQLEGVQFLREVCDYDRDHPTLSVSSAWFDLRLKVIELAKAADAASG
jgi:hypothetical protein